MRHAAIARPKPLLMAHVLLLLADQPRHGYDVAEWLRMWEFDGVTASVVYRDLARLEEEGLVRSFWSASQARGPARHMYELTPAGRDDLAVCAQDIRSLIDHLTQLLVRFPPAQPVGVPVVAPPAADRVRRRRLWRALERPRVSDGTDGEGADR
jgi:DNA-binding PadR family transcriptional regulator